MMTTRRILIFAPVFLILLLLQSYFWVPTYEQQTRGNPEPLKEYITASIGDASTLESHPLQSTWPAAKLKAWSLRAHRL